MTYTPSSSTTSTTGPGGCISCGGLLTTTTNDATNVGNYVSCYAPLAGLATSGVTVTFLTASSH